MALVWDLPGGSRILHGCQWLSLCRWLLAVLRGRCLGAAESRSSEGWDKCEVNTVANAVVAACSTAVGVCGEKC